MAAGAAVGGVIGELDAGAATVCKTRVAERLALSSDATGRAVCRRVAALAAGSAAQCIALRVDTSAAAKLTACEAIEAAVAPAAPCCGAGRNRATRAASAAVL